MHKIILSAVLFALIALVATAQQGNNAPTYTAIPVSGFSDSINHYRHDDANKAYPRYAPEEIDKIAANMLLYQRSNGGWSKNWDPLRILSADEQEVIRNEKELTDTTFDNRTTYTQIDYLAHTYLQIKDPAYKDAVLKGIQFILNAQYDNGGWPQYWPDASGYRQQITLNDDVLTGLLFFLRSTQNNNPAYAMLPDKVHAAISEAVRKADALILQLQIVVDGKRTIWAGQYDHETLQPATARSYELPSLISAESVKVVRYLMRVEPPSPEIVEAVSSAVAWFENSKISGIKIERVDIDPVQYGNHTVTFDKRVVKDDTAPPIWARFYEIDTNRPFMANRDGTKVYTLAEVAHERRTGYGWYTYAPAALLEKEYPEWKQKLKRK